MGAKARKLSSDAAEASQNAKLVRQRADGVCARHAEALKALRVSEARMETKEMRELRERVARAQKEAAALLAQKRKAEQQAAELKVKRRTATAIMKEKLGKKEEKSTKLAAKLASLAAAKSLKATKRREEAAAAKAAIARRHAQNAAVEKAQEHVHKSRAKIAALSASGECSERSAKTRAAAGGQALGVAIKRSTRDLVQLMKVGSKAKIKGKIAHWKAAYKV